MDVTEDGGAVESADEVGVRVEVEKGGRFCVKAGPCRVPALLGASVWKRLLRP